MADKKKILFIVNPISGVGKQKTAEKAIAEKLDLSVFDYSVAYTAFPHHGEQLAKEAASAGFGVVVAVGGDGSVNDVAQGLVNTGAVLGIIPAGSGNGLARHLGISRNINKAIETINRYNVSKIDTATLNGKLFLSIAGLGFDALVAEKFSEEKNRGFRSYFKIILTGFHRYKPAVYTISFEGKKTEHEALMISFANSGQFGFNANIAPSASLTDGLVDVCAVNKISMLRAATIAYRLFTKSIDRSKYVEVFKAREISVTCGSLTPSHIDGDFNEQLTEANVSVLPLSLNIIIP